MVYLVIPAEDGILTSFLYKGRIQDRSQQPSTVYDGVSKILLYSDGRVVGPFDLVSDDGGSVSCGISEPVLSVPHGPVRVPMRISDTMASRLLSSAKPAPGYVPVTGDSFADGLLASAEDGRIRFVSEDWDVMSRCTSVLSGLKIPFSMTSPFEIHIDDEDLCSKCAAIPVPSRIPDDGFMSGFLAPRTSAGRVLRCPDWAVEAYGGKVIVARDPYGNPTVSPMCSKTFPFDRIGRPEGRADAQGVPESFAFAAAEAIYLSALESGGYAVSRVWSDSMCSMCRASKDGSALTLVLIPRLCDEAAFQMRDHDIPESARVVALGRKVRSAPMERVKPFLSARGIDWKCVSALSDPGPDVTERVAAEAERCLGAVWGAYSS